MSEHGKHIPLTFTTDHMTEGDVCLRETCYLIVQGGSLVVLGSGRYAIVVLASKGAGSSSPRDLYAVKFLKDDPESPTFAAKSRERFYEEVAQMRRLAARGNPAFIPYQGFGTLPCAKNTLPVAAQALVRELPGFEEVGQEDANAIRQAALPSQLQGEFFVMTATQGTLDDLLLRSHPWATQPLCRAVPALAHDLKTARKEKASDVSAFLAKYANAEKLAQDRSGLGILTAFGARTPTLRNRIVVELFLNIATSLSLLHEPDSQKEDVASKALAHRDVKPGNFLLSFSPKVDNEFPIFVSDLGFVATMDEVTNGLRSMAASTRQPGALAAGTYLFRAPEQVIVGYELQWEAAKNADHVIRVADIGDMAIEPGDWLESDELERGGDVSSERVPSTHLFRSRIEQVVRDGGHIVLTLKDKFAGSASRLYTRGTVVKQPGQHTDIFAFGAMLYFVISGGKNPESFASKCLAPESKNCEVKSAAGRVYASCVSLTMALCLEDPRELGPVAKRLVQGAYGKYYRTVAHEQWYEDAMEVCKLVSAEAEFLKEQETAAESGRTVKPRGPGDEEMALAGYIDHLRKSPAVLYHCSDRNGKAISFPILLEIVRLMRRDLPDSYVRIPDEGTAVGAPGYFGQDLTTAIGMARRELQEILRKEACCDFESTQYQPVASSGPVVLLWCRLFGEDAAGEGGAAERNQERHA
jgi:serine/threonine protein kinase